MAPSTITRSIRTQWWIGLCIALTGAGFLVTLLLLALSHVHDWPGFVPPALGIALIVLGRREMRQTHTRWHGLASEARAVTHAQKILPRYGFTVEHNVVMRGRGDIDMVIGRAGQRAPVEIKSFRSWDRSDRSERAVAQAERARDYLHAAHAFVWLPDARVGWWRRWFGVRCDTTRVAFGHVRNLARVARRRMR